MDQTGSHVCLLYNSFPVQLLFTQCKDILHIFLLGHFEVYYSSAKTLRFPRLSFFLQSFLPQPLWFLCYLSPSTKGEHFFFTSVLAWIRVKRLPPCVTGRIATSCVQKRHAVVWDAGTTKGFQMSRIPSRVAEPHDLLCSHFLCSVVIRRLASTVRFPLCLYQPIPTEF